jgi:hypothetical protein
MSVGRSATRAGENIAAKSPIKSMGKSATVNETGEPGGSAGTSQWWMRVRRKSIWKIIAARMTSAEIMIHLRGSRSASAPKTGPKRKKGNMKTKSMTAWRRVTSTTPGSRAFCSLRRAISERWSPNAETP